MDRAGRALPLHGCLSVPSVAGMEVRSELFYSGPRSHENMTIIGALAGIL